MQTFLPYPDFKKSAECLDNKRLGKQRVECLQILKALTDPNYGWKSHPIVKMWKGYEQLLVRYGLEICKEWKERGFKDNTASKIEQYEKYDGLSEIIIGLPKWLGNEQFHLSHQSNLVRKNPEYYRKYFAGVPDNLPYEWYNPETKKFYHTK